MPGRGLPQDGLADARLVCDVESLPSGDRSAAGNLVEGMQWLQSTFSMRYNRLRNENGHLFQGRYKSLMVDPDEGLGPLCYYIHLNPVRAKVCSNEELTDWPWSSLSWLMNAKKRLPWFQADVPLAHAGALVDSTAGRKNVGNILPGSAKMSLRARPLNFDRTSKGWAIGSTDFKKHSLKNIVKLRP